MDEATRNSFKSDLDYLINFNRAQANLIENFSRNLNKHASNPRASDLAISFETDFMKSSELASLILNSFTSINFGSGALSRKIVDFAAALENFRYYFCLEEPNFRELDNVVTYSSSVIIKLNDINEIIDLSFIFNYIWGPVGNAATELGKYDSRGSIINSDPGYNGSPIEMLENFALNRINSIRNYIGADFILHETDDFSKLFFAIVAPSMTGKTQAAFTFRRVRCLYFLLSEKSEDTQEIYKNFEVLSEVFRKFIKEDFAKLKKLNALNGETGDIYKQISSTELLQVHGATKFKTLGFIYSLIEHANANFDPNGDQSWMRFFVTSSRSLIIEAKSLLDFHNFDLGTYVMFFDEFEASEENAFVRNLFRTIYAPVFVASTNSNAANLVGKVSYGRSRGGDSLAWSLAAIILNSINQNILNQIHPLLGPKIETIISLAANDRESNLIRLFFDNFFTEQLAHFRPGFVDLFAAKIVNIPNATGFTLNILLQDLVAVIFKKMIDGKPTIKTEPEGILGSLALFMDNAYLSSNITHTDLIAKLSHMKAYLQHHYYYLINPVDVNKWCFLTYRPAPGSPFLRYFLRDMDFRNWIVEYTYFKAEEIIPSFACQAITASKSIPLTLKEGLITSDGSARTTGRTSNPSQAVPLDGSELEVLSSICVIDASQHKVGDKISTYFGQDGKSFLINLIGNLIEADDYRRTDKVDLDCSIISPFINDVHVPFMFPAGMDLPPFYRDNFSSPQEFLNRSVNFGKFERTRNSNQIDQKFNFFIKNGTETPPSNRICTVECKNWNENLLASDLTPILDKAVANSAKVCLLFCNNLGVPTDGTVESFVGTCVEKNYLVLKVKEIERRKDFELVPYCPGLPELSGAVRLICIIFELFVIDPDRLKLPPKQKPKPKPEESKPKTAKTTAKIAKPTFTVKHFKQKPKNTKK